MNLAKSLSKSLSKSLAVGLAGGEGGSVFQQLKSLFGSDLLAYYPISDSSGTVMTEEANGRNGTYGNVTLNQDGYKGKSGYWGSTSYASIYQGAQYMNLNEWTIMGFFKITAAVLADSSYHIITKIRTSDGGQISLLKLNIPYRIAISYVSNSVSTSYVFDNFREENWFCISVSRSVTLGLIDFRINGNLSYDRRTVYTPGIPPMGTTILGAQYAGLGSDAGTSAVQSLLGSICHFSLINRYVTESEFDSLLKYNHIIFDGDSRTANNKWHISALPSINCAPRDTALSGANVVQLISYAPTYVDAKFRANRNNIISFWGGVNSEEYTTQEIYNQIRTYCLARKSAGFKVCLCTEIDAQDSARLAAGWPTKYLALNILLRAGYTEFADQLVDLGAITELQDATNTTYFVDLVHLTAAGYALVATAVKEKLALLV